MPDNRWTVVSDGGPGLDGTGGIAIEAGSGLTDQRQEQREIELLLLAIRCSQGVKIIGKIIREGGREVEFDTGGIVGLQDLAGEGAGECRQNRKVFGPAGIDQQGKGWKRADGGPERLEGVQDAIADGDIFKYGCRNGPSGVDDQFIGEGQALPQASQGGVAERDDIKVGTGLDLRKSGRMAAAKRPGQGGCAHFIAGNDLQDGVARGGDGLAKDGGNISGTDNNGLHTVFLCWPEKRP